MSLENTTVYFYKDIPFSVNGPDTRNFGSVEEQNTYFNSRVLAQLDENYYVHEGSMNVDLPYSLVKTANYLAYNNKSHEDKWYYCYIDETGYLADGTASVTFTIDSYQTYMFDHEITGFVEQEHCDYNVLNTLPESVGTGDYIVSKHLALKKTGSPRVALITTTTLLEDPIGYAGGTTTTDPLGASQPYTYYIVNASNETIKQGSVNGSELAKLSDFTKVYAGNDKIVNKVVSVQILEVIPVEHTIIKQGGTWVIQGASFVPVTVGTYGYALKIPVNRTLRQSYSHSKIGGSHTQDAVKLNNYPYTVLEITNGVDTVQLKPELIEGNTVEINEIRSLEIDVQVSYAVQNYAGDRDYFNMLTYSDGVKMPVVSEELAVLIQSRDNAYLSGALTSIATGAGMIALAGLAPGASAVLGATTMTGVGNVTGGVGSGIGSIIDRYKQTEKAKRMPNSIQGTADKLIKLLSDAQPNYLVKTQTPEYISLIAHYFKCYGWKTLKNKKPNLRTRQSFNFVKMDNVVVHGNIPQKAKEEIQLRFMKGITLWHIDSIGNYNVSNGLR